MNKLKRNYLKNGASGLDSGVLGAVAVQIIRHRLNHIGCRGFDCNFWQRLSERLVEYATMCDAVTEITPGEPQTQNVIGWRETLVTKKKGPPKGPRSNGKP